MPSPSSLLIGAIAALTVPSALAMNAQDIDPKKHQVPTLTGACVSGNWSMGDATQWKNNDWQEYIQIGHNPDQYPFVIMNNPQSVSWEDDGVRATMTGATREGGAVTMAFTRYMRFARISLSLEHSTTSGTVTAFNTMSDEGDEIDFEFLGNDPQRVQSNIWWRSLWVKRTLRLCRSADCRDPNTGAHGSNPPHAIQGGAARNVYTMDWRSDRIDWIINNRTVRTVRPGDEDAAARRAGTPLANGTHYYPTDPALIKFGIWDYTRVGDWAGKFDWTAPGASSTAKFNWLAIQCYDGNNRPVARFGDMPVPTAIQTTTVATGAPAAPTAIAPPPGTDNKSTGNRDPLSAAGRNIAGGVVGLVAVAAAAFAVGL
ncbi:hypothetical protein HK097_007995 [Rhizophlyctis rosea]|uniref:GH16 domain-containing protein n=1 Tax=Rhizophlyctis rosea TaxID=64517 RepID=A0AAD5X4U4_9FUNG|nr:hypothetical protein HK097_007995 [Rhizophlyctis rosea]